MTIIMLVVNGGADNDDKTGGGGSDGGDADSNQHKAHYKQQVTVISFTVVGNSAVTTPQPTFCCHPHRPTQQLRDLLILPASRSCLQLALLSLPPSPSLSPPSPTPPEHNMWPYKRRSVAQKPLAFLSYKTICTPYLDDGRQRR